MLRIQKKRNPFSLLLVFAFLAAFATTIEMEPLNWVSLRLSEDLETSNANASVGFTIMIAGSVLMRFFGDHLLLKIGKKHFRNLTMWMALLGLLLGVASSNSWISSLGFSVSAMGSSAIFPWLSDSAAKQPGKPAAVLGMANAGARLSGTIGPVIVDGLAAVEQLTIGTALLFTTVPAWIAFMVLRIFVKPSGSEETPS